jgi:hypothetical protein
VTVVTDDELLDHIDRLIFDSEARILDAIRARTIKTPRDQRLARFAALLWAIAEALGADPHLPFSTSEILTLADTNERLALALAALDAHDTARLGCLFRSIAKLENCGGLRLRREGEAWALAKATGLR